MSVQLLYCCTILALKLVIIHTVNKNIQFPISSIGVLLTCCSVGTEHTDAVKHCNSLQFFLNVTVFCESGFILHYLAEKGCFKRGGEGEREYVT